MQVLLKLNNGELQLMTEENFETIHELKGISSYTILGWLHDKKPICNMCNDYLDDDSRPVGAQVIKTEADTVNTISANQRAKRWAMMNFDKWNEVTGFVDPHISYYDEITALIEDAVEFGYGVALKQPLKEIMKVIKKSEGSL